MKSLRTICLIILALAFVMAVVLLCIGDEVIHPSSKTKLKDWSIQLNEESRYYPGIGTYKGTMSEEDCKTIWGIWNKYEHKDGCFDNVSDVFFRISEDKDHPEFFEYDDRDGLIQYCKIVDYNDWDKNTRTFAYLSEEDQAAALEIINKIRSSLIQWTLEVGDSKYELTSESIKAFSDLWNNAYRYSSRKEAEKSDELFKEKSVKDPNALFTITLHNCWEDESYFAFKGGTLKLVTIGHNTQTGEYYEYHRWVVLKPESLAEMWKIVEDYTPEGVDIDIPDITGYTETTKAPLVNEITYSKYFIDKNGEICNEDSKRFTLKLPMLGVEHNCTRYRFDSARRVQTKMVLTDIQADSYPNAENLILTFKFYILDEINEKFPDKLFVLFKIFDENIPDPDFMGVNLILMCKIEKYPLKTGDIVEGSITLPLNKFADGGSYICMYSG